VKLHRPELFRLIGDATQGDILLVEQVDRLSAHEATQGLLDAVNRMLLEMLAVVARKDYEDRRRRQAQGIAKAKESGAYKGRRANQQRHQQIAKLLARGFSWSKVEDITSFELSSASITASAT
jgi:DNA invertase Pin-like site-specific DNA recombinase